MKTIEMFAGIGGFRLASDRCGFRTAWANDFCPKACKVYRDVNGVGSIHEGDVKKILDDIPPHDLLTAGFPCQPFSSAGKKQGIKDPRGTLFSVVVDAIRRMQPRFFILENVKRLLSMEKGVHFATILASLAELKYHIEWRLLNAADFGLPQNRLRVFVVGARVDTSTGANLTSVKLATLADLSLKATRGVAINSPELWPEIASHGNKFPNWGLAFAGRFCGAELDSFSEAIPLVTLESMLQDNVAAGFDFTESTVERLKSSKHVKRFVSGVEILSNQGGGARMGYTVFGTKGLALPSLQRRVGTTNGIRSEINIGD